MQERGRVQEGMVADITIFDPETISDSATYVPGENGLPSTGIPYVLISGVVKVKDSVVQDGVYPGQPIRHRNSNRFWPTLWRGCRATS